MKSVNKATFVRHLHLISAADVLGTEQPSVSAVASVVFVSDSRDESKDEPRWRQVEENIVAAAIHSRQNSMS